MKCEVNLMITSVRKLTRGLLEKVVLEFYLTTELPALLDIVVNFVFRNTLRNFQFKMVNPSSSIL